MIFLDLVTMRPSTVHSSVGVGVAVNLTVTSTSSPFFTVYFVGVSGSIFGGVSVTIINKEVNEITTLI